MSALTTAPLRGGRSELLSDQILARPFSGGTASVSGLWPRSPPSRRTIRTAPGGNFGGFAGMRSPGARKVHGRLLHPEDVPNRGRGEDALPAAGHRQRGQWKHRSSLCAPAAVVSSASDAAGWGRLVDSSGYFHRPLPWVRPGVLLVTPRPALRCQGNAHIMHVHG